MLLDYSGRVKTLKTIAALAVLLGGFSVTQAFAANTSNQAGILSTAVDPQTTTCVVQPGDTLSAVAAAFHTTVSVLSAQNNIANPNLIYSGERLVVPAPVSGLPSGSQAMVCTLTAYTDGYESTGKYPGQPGYGITSTGQQAKQGLSIAVDPSVIPYGTAVFIPGVGLRIADDTGGAIVGSHIDVFYNREQTAVDFGVQRNVVVYIIPRSAVAFRHRLPVFAAMNKESSGSRLGQRVYGAGGQERLAGSTVAGFPPPPIAPKVAPLTPVSASAAAATIPMVTPAAAASLTPASAALATAATAAPVPSALVSATPATTPTAQLAPDRPGAQFNLPPASPSEDILNVWAISLARFVWQPMLEQATRALR